MSIDSKLTDEQNITLILLDKLNWNTDAAKIAVEFISGDELKQRLFNVYYDRIDTVEDVMERTNQAVTSATSALEVF
ncbi:DUF2560 family protein [Serratia liquefaciens]|uniref:DUF2560 family protein n=1 Tax=Serratia liquefaciens TaxID=614 RepID=UPI0021C57909|nr:DUF2560 family protein [Serratia liquefaciens]